MKKQQANSESSPEAIIGLVLVSVLVVYFLNPFSIRENLDYVIRLIKLYPYLTIVPYTLFLIFIIFVLSQIMVLLTKSKLGTRISAHARDDEFHSKEIGLNLLLSLVISACFSALFFTLFELNYLNFIPTNLKEVSFYSQVVSISFGGLPGLIWFTYIQWVSRFFTKKNDEQNEIQLPPYPKLKEGVVLGSTCEDPDFDQSDIRVDPYWVTLGKKALRENIFIFGQIGSGKTSSGTLPIINQFLENFPKLFLMVIDPKCTLIKDLLIILKKLNLKRPVYHMKFGGDVRINFCKKDALITGDYQEHASEMLAATINFIGDEGGGNSNFWNFNTLKLYKSTMAYCYFEYNGYFTILDFLDVLRLAAKGEIGAHINELVSEEGPDGQANENYALDGEHEAVKHNLKMASDYFNKEFDDLDSKLKTSILTTATTFIDQLTEFNASQIFCPKKDDVTVNSFDEIINKNGIFLFDIENESVAKAMGTLVKLQFQKAVLNRTKDPDYKSKELPEAVSIYEEAQCTVSGGGGAGIGDDRYLSMSREAGGVSVYISQSHSSILNKMGKQNSFNEFIQNFRTILCFSGTDERTAKEITRIAGKKNYKKKSVTVNESMSNPNRNIFNSEFESHDFSLGESVSHSIERVNRIEPSDVAQLSKFEAFALVAGAKPKFYKIYGKPVFLENKEILHKDLIEMVTEDVA